MKGITVIPTLLILLFTAMVLQAQEKNYNSNHNPFIHSENHGIKSNGVNLNPFSTHLSKQIAVTALDTFTEFPFMQTNISGGVPVVINNDSLMLIFTSLNGVFFSYSTNNGLNWGNPYLIATDATNNLNYPTAIKTVTGRIYIVVSASGGSLKRCYSDNNGLTWTTLSTIASGFYYYPFLTQTVDGKIWLFYSKNISGQGHNLYYRTSSTNGSSWSGEQTFLATSYSEMYGSVISTDNNPLNLTAFYSDNSSGNYDIYKKSSTDGGVNWSAAIPVVNSMLNEFNPKLLKENDSTYWMVYSKSDSSHNMKPIYGMFTFSNSEIYYMKSTDHGNTWLSPVRWTTYAGPDYFHNSVLVNKKIFTVFLTRRWQTDIYYPNRLYYGISGTTNDVNTPPVLFYVMDNGYYPGSPVHFQALVDDNSGISDVKVTLIVNGVQTGPFQMYDDGLHNDSLANDYIYGTDIGPFNFLDEIIPYVQVVDNSGNTINVFAYSTNLPMAHDVGALKLLLYGNSILGDQNQYSYRSGYWYGNSYIYTGGLWIGTTIAGEPRVMNTDFNQVSDWKKISGTLATLEPGISDQDANIYYNDEYALSSPIGLNVHQQTYQWSNPTRDDFIVFKYTVKNRGVNGTLSNIYVSPWMDADISFETGSSYDKVGYDESRRLLYMYDNLNNPTGYIGLKLLGQNNPHTVRAYYNGEDPANDTIRYSFISSGTVSVPSTEMDWRMLMSVLKNSLAAGDSFTVTYGIVMGNGLTDLQMNADTMQAIFNTVLVGIDENNHSEIVKDFDLHQNFPNPCNPTTSIKYDIKEPSKVSIKIYNTLGQEVRTLVNTEQTAGQYTIQWDGKNNTGLAVSSGVYIYRIQAGDFVKAKKMMFIK